MKLKTSLAALVAIAFVAGAQQPARLTAQEIVQNHDKAVGKDAYLKLQSRAIKGTVVIPEAGVSGTIESWEQAPNRVAVVIAIGEIKISEACDGKSCWQSGPEGLKEFTGTELAEKLRDAEFHSDVRISENFSALKYLGTTSVEGRESHIVEGSGPNREPETFYFDAKTWLENRRDSRSGGETQELLLGDYREIDGIKFPFQMKEAKSGMTFRLQEVRHNVPVDPRLFAKPAAKP